MDSSTKINYISLCSGYEGIGRGIESVLTGLNTIAYCEREAFAVDNLVQKMEQGFLDEAPVFTDVSDFPWREFRESMGEGILSFGWPCQPVSLAGNRKATEDDRWLFDIIADGIKIMRPRMLFAENVYGLLTAKMPDGTLVWDHCIRRLWDLGYTVKAGIFSAAEAGAPHQRKRVFIMAYLHEKGLEGLREGSNQERRQAPCGHSGGCNQVWPSTRGEQQDWWEPPRVVMGNPSKVLLEGCEDGPRKGEFRGTDTRRNGRTLESKVCRNIDGPTDRMDYAELLVSSDDRVDELMMLGNGVVPQQAALAFRTLIEELL